MTMEPIERGSVSQDYSVVTGDANQWVKICTPKSKLPNVTGATMQGEAVIWRGQTASITSISCLSPGRLCRFLFPSPPLTSQSNSFILIFHPIQSSSFWTRISLCPSQGPLKTCSTTVQCTAEEPLASPLIAKFYPLPRHTPNDMSVHWTPMQTSALLRIFLPAYVIHCYLKRQRCLSDEPTF